jgi:peptidoglycan hydrolase CwlO-like protein
MRFLRPLLCKLLNVSVAAEQSAHARILQRKLKRLEKQMQTAHKEHQGLVHRLEKTISDLQKNIEALKTVVENRDRQIEKLEHDKEILQIDVRGLTSVNARCVKWVESLRTAETQETAEHHLHRQLKDIEDSIPWEVS